MNLWLFWCPFGLNCLVHVLKYLKLSSNFALCLKYLPTNLPRASVYFDAKEFTFIFYLVVLITSQLLETYMPQVPIVNWPYLCCG